MSTEQSFPIHLIEAIAWPMVVLIVTFAFHEQWRGLIGQLRSLRIGHGSFGVEVQLQEASNASQGHREHRIDESEDGSQHSRDCDPAVILMISWNRLSVRLQLTYLRSNGLEGATRSAKQQVEELRLRGVIDEPTAELINSLRRARNVLAFHREDGDKLSPSQAMRYQELADRAIQRLDDAAAK